MDERHVESEPDKRIVPVQRPGDMFFLGALASLVVQQYSDISFGWLFALALFVGWAMNEWEKRHS